MPVKNGYNDVSQSTKKIKIDEQLQKLASVRSTYIHGLAKALDEVLEFILLFSLVACEPKDVLCHFNGQAS